MKNSDCSCLSVSWCLHWFAFGFLFYNPLVTHSNLEGEFHLLVALRIVICVAQFDILSAWKVTGLWNKFGTPSSHLIFKASESICKLRPCIVLVLVSTNTALKIDSLYCWTKQMQQNPVMWSCFGKGNADKPVIEKLIFSYSR